MIFPFFFRLHFEVIVLTWRGPVVGSPAAPVLNYLAICSLKFSLFSQATTLPTTSSFPPQMAYTCHHRWLYTLALLAITVATILPCVSTQCNGNRSVKVEVQYKWTKDRDAAFPNKDPTTPAGFTQLLCASTKQKYAIWRDGEVLVPNVRTYVKEGRDGRDPEALQVLIKEELDSKVNNSIWEFSYDDSHDFVLGDNRSNLTLTLNGDLGFTYVNCIATISPSADWFIGVYDINMCDNTDPKNVRWAEDEFRVVLFGYDGGSYDTKQYDEDISPEKAEKPSLNVRRIRTVAPRGYGEMNITASRNGNDSGGPSSDDDKPSCFPADEMVVLHSSERIPMDKLTTRNRVLINAQASPQIVTSSDVFAFSHRD